MSNNPFSDQPGTNPYAPPALAANEGPRGNPLWIPGIALLVLSTVFLLLILASMPGQFMRMRQVDTSTPGGAGELTGMVAGLAVWTLTTVSTLLGAISMIRLSSYRSAYIAAVLSVIPICSPCFVLGIPFGIWSLVLLHWADVRERFSSK
jgi:hypothetical protein